MQLFLQQVFILAKALELCNSFFQSKGVGNGVVKKLAMNDTMLVSKEI